MALILYRQDLAYPHADEAGDDDEAGFHQP